MAKKQDPENQDDPKLDDDGNPIEDPEEEGTDDPNQQSADDEPPDDTDQDDDDDRDWEASYKGLQKVVSRKEKAAQSLKAKYDKLSEQHEAQKTKSGAADTATSDLEKQLKEAKTELDDLTSERDKLNNQLSQTNLVMEKFPEIAPLAQYIPTADTIEDFEKNAKKFAEDVGAQIETGVDKKLEGASPDAPPGEEGLDTENEKDKLWDELNELGRDPEKNTEYEAKFKEWEALFDTD